MLESGHVVAFTAATDLRRAREFYEGILGLRVADYNDFACVLDANGTMVRITAVPEVAQPGYTVLGWRVLRSRRPSGTFPAGVWPSCAMTGWIRMAMASGPLLAVTRSPGSPTLMAIPCRSPSSVEGGSPAFIT